MGEPADLSLAWHAHAPPPPPRSPGPGGSPFKPARRSSYAPPPRSYSNSNSADTAGGFLPEDTHSPEPERPRTSSRPRSPVKGANPQQHPDGRASGYARAEDLRRPASVQGLYGYAQAHSQMYSAPTSPVSSPSPATYSPHQPTSSQHQPQQQYTYGHYPAGPTPVQHYATLPQPQPQLQQQQQQQHTSPEWQAYYAQQQQQQPSAWAGPSSGYAAAPLPAQYGAYNHPSAQAQAPSVGAPSYRQPPASYSYYQQPASAAAYPSVTSPPPLVTSASPAPARAPAASEPGSPTIPPPSPTTSTSSPSLRGTRPLPQPTRSFSAGPGSLPPSPAPPSHPGSPAPSVSGTIRRALPQLPPTPGAMAANSAAGVAPLGGLERTTSVRNAAEALMARGPPRRRPLSSLSRGSTGSPGPMGPPPAPGSGIQTEGIAGVPPAPRATGSLPANNSGTAQWAAQGGSGPANGGVDAVVENMRRMSVGPGTGSARELPPSPLQMYSTHGAQGAQQVIAPQGVPFPGAGPSIEVFAEPPARPPSRGARSPGPASPRRASAPVVAAVPSINLPPTSAAPAQGVPSILLPGEEPLSSRNAPAPAPASVSRPALPIISLPSDDAPPADGPQIAISSVDDGGDMTPSISVSGPSISVSGPSISISGAEDSANRPTISIPDSSAEIPSITGSKSGDVSAPRVRGPPARPQEAASASGVGTGQNCAECGKWIGGRVVHAMGRAFHPDCFHCSHCSEPLEHVAFYAHEGRAYCHFDYHELFSRRCFHCRTPIVDERFITISDPELGERDYHDLHFFCANCGDPFLDPKAAGSVAGADPNLVQADEEGTVQQGGKAFVVHKGYPYCEKCHINLHKPRCKGCRQPIVEELVNALNAKWHPHCFVCESCKRPFESENFFAKAGKAYDEHCYRVLLRNEL